MKFAVVLLKLTRLAPVNAVPVIVTVAVTPPLAGVKLETVGAGIKVKFELLVAVPEETPIWVHGPREPKAPRDPYA